MREPWPGEPLFAQDLDAKNEEKESSSVKFCGGEPKKATSSHAGCGCRFWMCLIVFDILWVHTVVLIQCCMAMLRFIYSVDCDETDLGTSRRLTMFLRHELYSRSTWESASCRKPLAQLTSENEWNKPLSQVFGQMLEKGTKSNYPGPGTWATWTGDE